MYRIRVKADRCGARRTVKMGIAKKPERSEGQSQAYGVRKDGALQRSRNEAKDRARRTACERTAHCEEAGTKRRAEPGVRRADVTKQLE